MHPRSECATIVLSFANTKPLRMEELRVNKYKICGKKLVILVCKMRIRQKEKKVYWKRIIGSVFSGPVAATKAIGTEKKRDREGIRFI